MNTKFIGLTIYIELYIYIVNEQRTDCFPRQRRGYENVAVSRHLTTNYLTLITENAKILAFLTTVFQRPSIFYQFEL